jgi:hypothetical protein
MKYKASRDIPKFARRYKTVNHTKLATVISMELETKVKSQSIRSWLRRHPTDTKELNDYIRKKLTYEKDKKAYDQYLSQRVLAELYVDSLRDLEITDLETLNLAYRYLAIVEEDLRVKICNQLNLKVIRK